MPDGEPPTSQNRMSLVNMLNENEQIDQDEAIVLAALGAIKTQPFFQRVSEIPLVNRTVSSISNAYENTKNSSGVLKVILAYKYSAESVEQVTKTITKPVLSTLGPVLTPLERFANNQLDKVQRNFPSIVPSSADLLAPPSVPLSGHEFTSHDSYSEPDQPSSSQTFTEDHQHSFSDSEQPKSRWPKVVGSVGANLGMLSDETIKALRYCLQYLQYAISHMQHQISILKHALQNAATATKEILTQSTNADGTPATNIDNINVLISAVKREIVETIRRVVDMLGNYSSQYLPLDAKQNATVRPQTPMALEHRQQEAENVITLAQESKKMLENIEHVINTTVISAEHTLGYKEPLTPKNSKEDILMGKVQGDAMDES